MESKEILRKVLKGEPSSIMTEMIEHDLLYLPDTLTLSEGLNAFKTSAQPLCRHFERVCAGCRNSDGQGSDEQFYGRPDLQYR